MNYANMCLPLYVAVEQNKNIAAPFVPRFAKEISNFYMWCPIMLNILGTAFELESFRFSMLLK